MANALGNAFAYVRWTMYDGRCTIRGVPALARELGEANTVTELRDNARTWLESGGGTWRCLCTTYDVGCTIY